MNKSKYFLKYIYILYIGITLSLYSKRIGWDDTNVNYFNIILRTDLWVSIYVIFNLCSNLNLYLLYDNIYIYIIFIVCPLLYFISASFATFYAYFMLNNNVSYDALQYAFRIFIYMFLTAIVFIKAFKYKFYIYSLINIFKYVSIINCISLIIAKLLFYNNNLELMQKFEFYSYGSRFQAISSNPNIVFVTSFTSLSIMIPEIIINFKINKIVSILKIIYSIVLIDCIISTGVRAVLVVFPIVIFVFFVMNCRSYVFLKRFLNIIFIFILLIILLNYINYFNIIIDRVNSNDGRINIWLYYIIYLLKNPIGFGFGYLNYFNSIDTNILRTHNAILEQLITGGLLNIIPYLLITFSSIKLIFDNIKYFKCSIPIQLQSLILAWISLYISIQFAGSFYLDIQYCIIFSMLIAYCLRTERHLHVY